MRETVNQRSKRAAIVRATSAFTVVCLLLAPTSRGVAGDGRIPLYQVIAITQPGSYILTRDVVIGFGEQLSVTANGVDIDLNGYSIRCPSTSCGALVAATSNDLVIHNGGFVGGYYALAAGSSRVRLDHVRITNCQHGISGGQFIELTASSVSTIYSAVESAVNARIVDSTFDTGDYGVIGISNGIVENNVFNCHDAAGISLLDGNLIRGNLFYACNPAIDLRNSNVAEDNVVRTSIVGLRAMNRNRITRNRLDVERPVRLQGDDNVFANNTLWASTDSGIIVDGSSNLVESNSAERSPRYGIEFVSGTGNLFRNNTLRNNQLGAVGGMVGDQVNGGGNYP